MLTLLPLPPLREHKEVRRARDALALAGRHPDGDEIAEAIDIISDAWQRLAALAPLVCDKRAREAISCERYGAIGVLSDAVSDLGYALECWRDENRENAA